MTDCPLRLAVFDCDGTLVDSQHAIVAAMGLAFAGAGLPTPEAAAVRRVVGLQLVEAIARLAPDLEAERTEELAASYVEAFHGLGGQADRKELLFPGMREVLRALDAAQVLLAIATGKSRRGLMRTLERHGIADRFILLKTADDGPGKPNPQILLDTMAEAGATPETTAMIGDTVFDMAMARSAKAYAIGVGWGYHEPEELGAAGAHAVVSDPRELPETLATIWRVV